MNILNMEETKMPRRCVTYLSNGWSVRFSNKSGCIVIVVQNINCHFNGAARKTIAW